MTAPAAEIIVSFGRPRRHMKIRRNDDKPPAKLLERFQTSISSQQMMWALKWGHQRNRRACEEHELKSGIKRHFATGILIDYLSVIEAYDKRKPRYWPLSDFVSARHLSIMKAFAIAARRCATHHLNSQRSKACLDGQFQLSSLRHTTYRRIDSGNNPYGSAEENDTSRDEIRINRSGHKCVQEAFRCMLHNLDDMPAAIWQALEN